MKNIQILILTILIGSALSSIASPGDVCNSYLMPQRTTQNYITKLFYGEKVKWFTINENTICTWETYEKWKLVLDNPSSTYYYAYIPYASDCTTAGTKVDGQTSKKWHKLESGDCGWVVAVYNNDTSNHTFESIFDLAKGLMMVTFTISMLGISVLLA